MVTSLGTLVALLPHFPRLGRQKSWLGNGTEAVAWELGGKASDSIHFVEFFS